MIITEHSSVPADGASCRYRRFRFSATSTPSAPSKDVSKVHEASPYVPGRVTHNFAITVIECAGSIAPRKTSRPEYGGGSVVLVWGRRDQSFHSIDSESKDPDKMYLRRYDCLASDLENVPRSMGRREVVKEEFDGNNAESAPWFKLALLSES